MSKKTMSQPADEPVYAKSLCEHCGTVSFALTSWPADVVAGCGCGCHAAKLYDRRKKGKRRA